MTKSGQARFSRRKSLSWMSVDRHARLLSLAGVILSVGATPEPATAYGAVSDSPRRDQQLGPAPAMELTAPSHPPREPQRPAIILAHAIVVRTSPAQGGVGAEDIGKVEVWYDAGIRDAFAALAVVSASGERVDKRDAAIDSADPSHVSVSVNRLTPGKYTARYRALSADGHLVSGAWEFEVRP
ncbi:MAG: copper resistance CopC family protein [Methylocystis sp.]|uniref:copper resistance CopC family protein n=1 Tax=Methylocystis sp. TaxID=1911079 RepID=UPI003DA31BB2